ncbi:MAG TPA: metallophosphoesterase [Ottowia sp.]|uniref:metallophosphoesterase family protein n=1 Tax=Ottowia sp. TaxID=1898956 RepID=UPI002C580DAC|nr:metallophosphoesterase [Ottowia sp.]HMN20392.1 metallophosphoesterase [Ottowia sp.]
MKLLHTADWQLGRSYGFDDGDADGVSPSAALSQARFDAVAAIAALAHQEQVDAVLVAGDVFDSQGVSDRSLRRTVGAMAGFAGRWVLLPGNHDAALAESVWTRLQRLDIVPPQVTLALQPGVLQFPELGLAMLAAPLTQRHTHDDLTAFFDSADSAPGLLRVGLAHGSVTGVLPEGVDSPNPIAADRAERARLDYLALGDWHGLKQVDTRTWYSGTPEPERFVANDPGHVLLVELDAPGAPPRVTPRRVGRYHWRQHAAEIRGVGDIDALGDVLAALDADTVLRLQVQGLASDADIQHLQRLLDAERARLHLLQADLTGLRLEPTEADLAALRLDGALAELVDELRALQQQDEQAELATEALKLLFDLARRAEAEA